jgi:hypothetical protein
MQKTTHLEPQSTPSAKKLPIPKAVASNKWPGRIGRTILAQYCIRRTNKNKLQTLNMALLDHFIVYRLRDAVNPTSMHNSDGNLASQMQSYLLQISNHGPKETRQTSN